MDINRILVSKKLDGTPVCSEHFVPEGFVVFVGEIYEFATCLFCMDSNKALTANGGTLPWIATHREECPE